MTSQQKAGMPVEEGNRLIAEFDGNIFTDTSQLKYHSSFDWLMPVVEKIVLLHEPFTLRIGNVRSWANFDGQEKQCEESTIITVWLSVVEAIKKYNTQTSNQ